MSKNLIGLAISSANYLCGPFRSSHMRKEVVYYTPSSLQRLPILSTTGVLTLICLGPDVDERGCDRHARSTSSDLLPPLPFEGLQKPRSRDTCDNVFCERVPLRCSNHLEEEFDAIESYADVGHEDPLPVCCCNFDAMRARGGCTAKDSRALYCIHVYTTELG